MREMHTLLFVWRLVRTLVLLIWSDTSTFVMRIFPNTPKLNAIMWPMMCIFPSSNAALHNTMHFEHWLWSEHWPCVSNKISIHHTWIGYGVIGMSKGLILSLFCAQQWKMVSAENCNPVLVSVLCEWPLCYRCLWPVQLEGPRQMTPTNDCGT